MGKLTAFAGAAIFDGGVIHRAGALLVEHGTVRGIVPRTAVPPDVDVHVLNGLLAPAFVDLQVNGGGGVLLNDAPTLAGLRIIAAAHLKLGTTAFLPTLITDTPETMDAAIVAVEAARGEIPGILGLHLEGPHLAPERKGAHPGHLMRPLTEADVENLIGARARVGVLLLTLAPEQAPLPLLRRLTAGGVLVSLGHSAASFEAAQAAFDAGARGVTHLFNAMSQLTVRAPGVVGAALDQADAWGGIIGDGVHVHAANVRLALSAKKGPGRLYFVTDAMAVAGTEREEFFLHGRRVRRANGRLTLDDGTLAGADTTMSAALRFGVRELGLPVEEALRMTSLYPAAFLGIANRGHFHEGARADIVVLDEDFEVSDVIWGGIR